VRAFWKLYESLGVFCSKKTGRSIEGDPQNHPQKTHLLRHDIPLNNICYWKINVSILDILHFLSIFRIASRPSKKTADLQDF
jgi:hypothetical protein